ncbi:hypothetical protein ABH931_003430 [Streptacidiphilus sp. MAP12-33]|uniref:Imm50 family immunity protein n=1 Tax=Streptacidiphilus sp. MAP12-33 TaxID=3156266 RepID=UPI003514F9FE
MATEPWHAFVYDREGLTRHYTHVPPLERVTLRSVHLSPWGPTLTLRFDLPRFADVVPPEWAEAGCDRLECQVEFLAVRDLRLRGMPTGRLADVELAARERPWLDVSLRGEGIELDLTCADTLRVGHLNAYRSADGDPNRARRWFVGPVDRRLYTTLPPTTGKSFYERL